MRHSQAVIQGVAPQRALRVIDALDDLVQHEVVPGAVIERHRFVARHRPRAMRLRDLLHPVETRQPGAPVRAQLQQPLLPRLSQQIGDGNEATSGKGQPDGRNHVAVTLTVAADPIPRGLLYNAASGENGGDGGNGIHRSNGINGGERSVAVRLVGVRSTPTAAMYESTNTSRRRLQSGLYLRSRTSRQAAFGGQSNGRHFFVIFVSFVVKKIRSSSFPSFLVCCFHCLTTLQSGGLLGDA